MKILVSGASGLVGRAVVKSLQEERHQVVSLVRLPSSKSEFIFWNPAASELDSKALEGFDAVIHLAGEPIADGVWTEARKKLIRESRIQGTELLSKTLASLRTPPSVMISASAIGIYGNRGDEILTEESSSGEGFLADVCREWEDSTSVAEQGGIRVVRFRIGLVLAREGGMLSKMLTPFRLGLGGPLGNGRQYMSWIVLSDLVAAILHVLKNKNLEGPVNATAPNPVTNEFFSKTLGRVLHRPAFMRVPAFVLKTMMREMAEELLLSGAMVKPEKLLKSGFRFEFENLEGALKYCTNR